MKLILAFALALFSAVALADDYTMSGSWTDPTPTGPGYTPTYEVGYAVAGGGETVVEVPAPSFTAEIVGNPGETVAVRVRAINTQGPINGNWTTPVTATLSYAATTPSDQTGLVITITRH